MVTAAFDLARQKPLTVTGMLQHIFFPCTLAVVSKKFSYLGLS